MSEPKLRVASGSQEDPVHRRAEQEAPREIPIPLTTEALAARGDSLHHLRRRRAVSISRSACPASLSTAAGVPEEQDKLRRRMDEYFLHEEYYKSVRGEDGEEPLEALGSPPHTDRGSYPYSAHLQTWPTLCLYPGDRECQHGVQSCQPLAGTQKCVQPMWRSPIPQGQPVVPWTVQPNYWPNNCLGPKTQM